MAALYGVFWSLLSAVSQCRGFRNRWGIERVLAVLLLSMDCARAADARGGATSALGFATVMDPLALNFGSKIVLRFSLFGC
jgi:hypothetical protein